MERQVKPDTCAIRIADMGLGTKTWVPTTNLVFGTTIVTTFLGVTHMGRLTTRTVATTASKKVTRLSTVTTCCRTVVTTMSCRKGNVHVTSDVLNKAGVNLCFSNTEGDGTDDAPRTA